MLNRKRIDFLIIGAQKSGTSSLMEYLNENLQINPPSTKEVHYFDFNYDKSKKWYHNHFTFSRGEITGEASPFYFFHPQAPERIHQYNPNLKLIAILRNPVERAWSQYRMNRSRNRETLSFIEALKEEKNRLREDGDFNNKYSSAQLHTYKMRGLYAEQLERWYQFFPKEQILVLNYHTFYEKPWENVQQIYKFLDVAPYFGVTDYTVNQSKIQEDMDVASQQLLEEYYKEPNKRLADLTGIKF